MAGLLDFMNDPETMGLLSASAGMFNASGPSSQRRSLGQVLGAGLQGGMQGVNNVNEARIRNEDRETERELMKQKLIMAKLQEQRAQAQFKMQQDAFNGVGSPMGGGSAANVPQGFDASGGSDGAPAMQPQAPQMPQMGGEAAKLDQLRRMAIAGVPGAKELFDIHKYQSDPMELKQGSTYRDRTTGQERMMPKLDNGIEMNNGEARFIPAYAQSVAAQAGLITGAQEAAKAPYQTTTIPMQGGTRMVSNSQLPQLLNGGGQRPPFPTPMNMQSPDTGDGLDTSRLSPEQRAFLQKQDPQAYERGASKFLGQAPMQQSGPGIALQSEAQRELEVGAAKTFNEVDKAGKLASQESKVKASKLYEQLSASIPMAREYLRDATGSGIGAMMDKSNAFLGRSTKSGNAADQLDTLGGWMTSNVPRMEGPQSDADRKSYMTMAAMVGDRTKPNEARLAALDTVEKLMGKYASINGLDSDTQVASRPTAQPLKKSAMKGQVMDGYRFRGGNPADQANWEKM